MVEYSRFGAPRKTSNVSDVGSVVDLSDREHCILCFNDMRFFGLGICNHKNVCHTCILRLRFILKDKKCPICKTQSEELLIAETQSITYEQFKKADFRKQLHTDDEDANIFYESGKVKTAGQLLRQMQCLVYNCNPGYRFPSLVALQTHLEKEHQKTFCKICIKGRLVFIREQRLYHLKQLRAHIEYGDPGNEK